MTILGEQAQVLEEEIERLYRNWFIETCDDWVVPYLGDLIGVRPTSARQLSTRAEVANALGYRRRKGTLAVVEQLARDVTGLPARAVEYFTLLSTTQNLNHLRMENHGTPNLRDGAALSHLGGPFERTTHLLEVRGIEHGNGRYNIPNIGVHLWRLSALELRKVMAHAVEDGTGLHFTFSPLGNDLQLFRRPGRSPVPSRARRKATCPIPSRDMISTSTWKTFMARMQVSQFGMATHLSPKSLCATLRAGMHPVPDGRTISIDPELGRIAFASEPASGIVRVLYHYGFSASLGGGSYGRSEATENSAVNVFHVGTDHETIESALAAWSGISEAERQEHPSVIQIDDSSTYRATLPPTDIPQGSSLIIRAAANQRPALLLEGDVSVSGGQVASFDWMACLSPITQY